MSEIPEDIMQAAREAYHSAFNEFGNAKDVDVYAAISRAILAERQRNQLEIKRLRLALRTLASYRPVSFGGQIQGQSDVRMRYAKGVLAGGKP